MIPNIIQFLVQIEGTDSGGAAGTSGVTAICGGADALRLLKFALKLLDVLHLVIPTILIVLLIIDLGKNVIAGNEDAMGKNLQLFIKRIIMCCALFLIPTFVEAAMGLVSSATVKISGANYSSCLGIALQTDDFSQYEIEWPKSTEEKKAEYRNQRNQARARVGVRETSSDSTDSSSSSSGGSSSGGDSGSSSDGDSGDSGSSDSSTTTSSKTRIIISDSAYTMRDSVGTMGGGIEWIQGNPSAVLSSSSTKDKINAVSKNSDCKVYIAGYVSSISSTGAAQNLIDAIATLKRNITDSTKCKFIVASVPPVDARASGYKNSNIVGINSRLNVGSYSNSYKYCSIYTKIADDCKKQCKTGSTGRNASLNTCTSACFTGNGINFAESYYKTYYGYLTGC